MKIRSEQLEQHLKNKLAPLYLVSGDEPLLVQEACDAIRAQAKEQGFDEREVLHVERGFDWQRLHHASQSLSLFSEKRLIECRLPTGKPGDAGGKAFQAYAKNPPNDTLLLIITNKLEASSQKSKWYKAIETTGVSLQIWPIDEARLPQWIQQRLQKAGFQADPAVTRLLAERVEGNLLACMQEIEKLQLLYQPGTLSLEQCHEAVTDSARFNVFTLVDSALNGDLKRVTHILQGLQAEGAEPTLILWALSRELRSLAIMRALIEQGQSIDRIMQQHYVWEKRKPVIKSALRRHSQKKWERLLQRAARIDRIIKGILPGNIWNDLSRLCTSVCVGGIG